MGTELSLSSDLNMDVSASNWEKKFSCLCCSSGKCYFGNSREQSNDVN